MPRPRNGAYLQVWLPENALEAFRQVAEAKGATPSGFARMVMTRVLEKHGFDASGRPMKGETHDPD